MMRFESLAGQQLGQYELRERLGIGGMGAVYRAYQPRLKRDVAIKVISAVLAGHPEAIRRFNREAEIIARLEHAHIVPIYDYGTKGDVSYVVMRLLSGGSLAERLLERARTERPLPALKETARLLTQIAGAVDYAHKRQIIHRDIKTNNIMFDDSGTAFLVDFGIARMLDATTSITGAGMAMGTPSHMAPEQWLGKTVTSAADQYSLGVVVYTLVTGHMPFEVDTPQAMMQKHLNELPPLAHTYRPELPESVSQVIEKALAKKPEKRYKSAGTFAEAFSSAVVEYEETITTDFFIFQLPEKNDGKPPPHQKVEYSAIDPTLTGENEAGMPTQSPITSDDPTTPLPVQQKSNIAALHEAVTPLAVKTKRRYWLWFLAITILLLLVTGGILIFIDDTPESGEPEEIADIQTQEITESPEPEPRITPRLFAEVSPSPEITLSPTIDSTLSADAVLDATSVPLMETLYTIERERVRSVAWAMDGRLVIADGRFIVIFTADNQFSEPVLEIETEAEEITSVTFSPDGKQIAAGTEDNTVLLYDAQSGDEQLTLIGHTDNVYSVVFSPVDSLLVSCGVDGTLRVWELETGEELAVMNGHTRSVEKLRFSPDGRYVASASSDRTLRLWDIETFETVRVFEGHTDMVLGVDFSPDGQYLISGSADRSIRVWDVETGGELEYLLNADGFVFDVVYSPSGAIFASADASGLVRIWDAATYEERYAIRESGEGVNSLAFHPDGGLLASGNASAGMLRVRGVVSQD